MSSKFSVACLVGCHMDQVNLTSELNFVAFSISLLVQPFFSCRRLLPIFKQWYTSIDSCPDYRKPSLVHTCYWRFLQSNFGDAPEITLPSWFIASLYAIVFFVIEDISRFLLHVGMHRVPVLWRLHRIHQC